jgi:TRAP transporter 4TM/12TM fusion protein
MTEDERKDKATYHRYAHLPSSVRAFFLLLSAAGIALFVIYVNGYSIYGYLLNSQQYYHLLIGVFGCGLFLTIPARRCDRDRPAPWFDYVFATFTLGVCLYWFFQNERILLLGWVPPPDTFNLLLAGVFAVFSIEAARRIGGWPFLCLVVVAAVYPLIARHMPGVFYGNPMTLEQVIGEFAFGDNGVLGLTGRVMGEILVGFLVFAGTLVALGAGDFFLDAATAIMGRVRGGPAKIAVVASGFFGSFNGSPIANVVGTGSFTIPAMKRVGYTPHYAAAIAACASSGGVIVPPVMGSIVFLIVMLAGVSYASVIVAATIPALLFYLSLFLQVDAYAARTGLRGLPASAIPRLRLVLERGWIFIAGIVALVILLVVFKRGPISAVYAAGIMILLSVTHQRARITPKKLLAVIAEVGNQVAFTLALFLPIGFIIIGLVGTGVAAAITAKIISLGGESLALVLLIGAAFTYVMGMFGMGYTAYLFLAVTMAPALVSGSGLSAVGTHLFIAYYSILGGITPPVALVSFVAAGMANAPAMKTAITSMRLGVVLIFIPFYFIFNPAFLMQGSGLLEIAWVVAAAALGIGVLAGGLEGYLPRIGLLPLWARPVLVLAGLLFAYAHWIPTVLGLAIGALSLGALNLRKRQLKVVARADVAPALKE